jgi:hypothetical protein
MLRIAIIRNGTDNRDWITEKVRDIHMTFLEALLDNPELFDLPPFARWIDERCQEAFEHDPVARVVLRLARDPPDEG